MPIIPVVISRQEAFTHIRMYSMQRQAALCFSLLATLGVAIVAADPPSKEKSAVPQDALMRAKLASTQSVVEGLVEKDFRMINNAAQELLKMCEGDDWESHEDKQYNEYRQQLQRQSKKLIDQAGSRNLEGATYAYLGVLSTCVDCHTHCRDVLMIATDAPHLRATPIPTTAVDDESTVIR